VAEDWRVTITLANEDDAVRVLHDLHEAEVNDELRDELGGRVAVSNDGPSIFLYADTRRAAEAGERALREALDEEHVPGEPQLHRWHPIEELWEDASVPLPTTEADREEERERLEDEETEESLESGVAQWEVRVELASPGKAEGLADELEREGWSVVRRSTYLIVGANDKDDAEALAARLADRGRVHVEPGAGVAWQFVPANPFAVFGGLAG
jgi:hypothetical protein